MCCLTHCWQVFSGCSCGPAVALQWSELGASRTQGTYGWHICSSHSSQLSLSFSLQTISAMKLMQFQGVKHKASSPVSLPPVQHLDLTPSPEVPLMIMKRKLMQTNDLQESRRLVDQIHRHLEVSPGQVLLSAS